ncbi:septum formation initiator family protein [Sphingobacterium sp. DK4209]|uniref:Septum formation initiator family protein n=1 Tax=Sphingobacterium zhuxiongii TaxID=2662364 RepID=A0A5Q0QAT4_9SPHI|nr:MULTISPECIES: septum formation initiator family protein [unclassified Sphingobacterium]MVZ66386.1 septum formation initiator family protein [Sphingobacterium sp. DK4209]QGA27237.1 septum formation initiator family protein [Sphingobacterium sp. dk4302]
MERVINTIRNKYLIAGVAFVVWMCFFDRYDFATQFSFQKEKTKLEVEKAYYTTEIENIENSIKDVQYNPSEIQRIAREKYKMKKDHEDVYIVTEVEPTDK